MNCIVCDVGVDHYARIDCKECGDGPFCIDCDAEHKCDCDESEDDDIEEGG